MPGLMGWGRIVRRVVVASVAASLTLAVVARDASAQTVRRPRVDPDTAQIFQPATDPTRFLSVYDTRNLDPGRFTLGLYVNYARNPLELDLEESDRRAAKLVEQVGGADLVAAIGITDRFQIGVDVPYVFTDANEVLSEGQLTEDGGHYLGDVMAEAKATILPRPIGQGFGLSLLPRVVFPTGDLDNYAGTGDFAYGGLLLADARYWKINFGLNLGYMMRDEPGSAGSGDELDDYFQWGTGITVPTAKMLDIVGEVNGRSAFANSRTNPIETMLAFRFHWGDYAFTVGGGAGINSGRGTPDFRVVASLTPYIPEKELPPPTAEFASNSRVTWKLVEDVNKDGRVNPGEVIEYEVTLVNAGTKEAEDVVFVFAIPERTVYVPNSMVLRGVACSDPGDPPDPCDEDVSNPGAVTAKIGTVPKDAPDNTANFTFRVSVDAEILDLTVIRGEATVYHKDQPAKDGSDDENAPRAGEIIRTSELTVFPSIKERDTVVVTPDRLELTKNIHFEFNKATIRPESYGILNDVAEVLAENPKLHIRVEGHTDSVGGVDFNQRLSDKRAASVKEYLVGRGTSAARLEPRGRGELAPIATNDTAVGRAINRRVEFLIVNPEALKGTRVEKEHYIEDITPESEPPGVAPDGPSGPSGAIPVGEQPSSGRVTLDAQRALTDLGLYRGPVNGIMGPATTEAVRRFQRENGLQASGIIDATTRKALDEAIALKQDH